jgi:CheY-like chemotaxis protein
VKELHDKPKNINPSSLRTIAQGLDLLENLFTNHDATAKTSGSPLVLVVDDEMISREMVCSALAKASLRTVSVDSPMLALKLLEENHFDLIFIDVEMPELNGFEVCKKVRAMPANKKTPVVFVTALKDFETRAQSALSGGSDLIAKPFLLLELAVKALTYVFQDQRRDGPSGTWPGHPKALPHENTKILMQAPKDLFANRSHRCHVPAMALALVCVIGWPHGLAAEEKTVAAQPQSSDLQAGEDFTQLNLEQLMLVKVPTVYGASKREQKITEAPSSVSIVTQDDIQKFGHRTLADVLRSVRGFYVSYDRGYSFIGVRGVNRPGDYGGRVLITVDGHRLNEPVYDSAFNGNEFPLDLDLIDRIEIIRGPGFIALREQRVLCRHQRDHAPRRSIKGVEASAAVASYDTYTG